MCVNRWIYKSETQIILETGNLRLWKPEKKGMTSVLHFMDKDVKSKKPVYASTHT